MKLTFNRKKQQKNEFGDTNYVMNDFYNANNLVIGNFERISSSYTDGGPMVEQTYQKYIFDTFIEDGKTKYREIFTGFIANDKVEFYDLPYVVNLEPFVEYLPNTMGRKIPKLSLIWAVNDINYPKEKDNVKKLTK